MGDYTRKGFRSGVWAKFFVTGVFVFGGCI